MPLSDADKPMEGVFTAFGHAAFLAFLWESELAALAMTLKRMKNPAITSAELEQFDALMRSKRTAGQMIDRELDEFLVGQEKLRAFFKKITDSRNRLIHRFYEEQIPNLNSESGKNFAIKEIETIARDLRAGCSFVRETYMQLARARYENVDAILEKAKEEAMKRWGD